MIQWSVGASVIIVIMISDYCRDGTDIVTGVIIRSFLLVMNLDSVIELLIVAVKILLDSGYYNAI